MDFPDGLQEITFGDGYTHNINKIKFPKRLERLIFGHKMNQSLENTNNLPCMPRPTPPKRQRIATKIDAKHEMWMQPKSEMKVEPKSEMYSDL